MCDTHHPARLQAYRPIEGVATIADVQSLLTTWNAAPSSLGVAEVFFLSVITICNGSDGTVNKVTCGAAGVIPAVIAATAAHRTASATVAAHGCEALHALAHDNTANADAIVLSAGGAGLEVICSVMEALAHAGNEVVQREACAALSFIADVCSPVALAAMRGSRVVDLLPAAMARFPTEGNWIVRAWATEALKRLTAQASVLLWKFVLLKSAVTCVISQESR